MKLLIKHFRRVDGRYRMARAIFDWSRDNTKQNNDGRSSYLAVLQGKITKFRAGYVGLKSLSWGCVGREVVNTNLEEKE